MQKCEIAFAYQSFHWNNNAKDKAGVTCVIVGIIGNQNILKFKYIYTNASEIRVNNISPYLINGSNLCVFPRRKPLSILPVMIRGSQPTDNGNLILSDSEMKKLLLEAPQSQKFIKKYVGAGDFINSKSRWCLWIKDEEKDEALNISIIRNRIEKCKEFRLNSKKEATRKKAMFAYKFDEVKHQDSTSIIFPVISSHRRKYVPIGFLDSTIIISNKGQVVYDATPYMFGVLSSIMHMQWLSVTSSRMRKDYQYSNKLSYNTFPFPKITDTQKQTLETHVFAVLEQRERHSEKTLAQLYDPDKMPDGLRAAHHELDLAVERCYRKAPFTSDEERLAYLFKLYEKMIAEEAARDTLFAKEKKKRKKAKK